MGPLVEEHTLLFWVQLAVLLALARALGHVARRLGQPGVVGELTAGVLLGPSVLGTVAPSLAATLFPTDGFQVGLLLAVAWLGAVLLLAVTGFDVDLPLVGRLLRAAPLLPVGSIVPPLAVGALLGFALPAAFVGPLGDRTAFVALVAVATAVSALPVIARILDETGLLRRDLGQLLLLTATMTGLVTWPVLGAVAGVVDEGRLDVGSLLLSLAAVVGFLVLAVAVGQRVVDLSLRTALRLGERSDGAVTVAVVVVLAFAAVGRWLGAEGVLGAFVAGVLLGRSPYRRPEIRQHLDMMSRAVLSPVFFATAGMVLDVRALAAPATVPWVVVVLVVASAAKVGGVWLGARAGGLGAPVALAAAAGLNARGALGVVVATVGLSLGVLSDVGYATLVLLALVTSMAAAPLLQRFARDVPSADGERARLEREGLFADSAVIGARRALVATSGGPHSRVAARLLDLALPPRATVTVAAAEAAGVADADRSVAELAELFGHRRVDRRVLRSDDAAEAILREVGVGHDLLVLGASAEVDHPSRMSPVLRQLLTGAGVPVVLVRAGEDRGEGLVLRRILTAAIGTPAGRAAEEVAYALGVQGGADVDVVHVVSRADQVFAAAWSGGEPQHPTATGLLARSVEVARRLGLAATAVTRVGASAYEELLRAATDRGADTIVVGTRVRDLDGDLFLGHGVEYLLQHTAQTLVVVALPSRAAAGPSVGAAATLQLS